MGQVKLNGGWVALQALFALGLGAVAIYTLADFWHLGAAVQPALLALACGSLISLVGHWRRWAGWALADVLLAALLYLVWARRPIRLYFDGILRHWQAWVVQVQTTPDWTFTYELGLFLLILTAVVVGWLITRDLLRSPSPLFTLVAGTAFFASLWALFYDAAFNYYLLFLVGVFAAWATGQAGRRQGLWQGEGRSLTGRVRLLPALFALLPLTVATAWVPPAWGPVDLGKVNLWVQERVPALNRFRGGSGGPGNFFTGFNSDVSRLGGAAYLSDEVVLTVDVLEAPDTNVLYLRGAAADLYTGQGWQRSLPTQLLEGGRTTQIRNSFAPEVSFKTNRVRIFPTAYGGPELFHPLEARFVNLSGASDGWVYDPSLGNLIADRSPNEPYTITASVPRWNEGQLRALTAGQPLGEPQTTGVTPYVQLLTDELVGSIDNPFDKARLIEAWLRATFAYTLEMEPTPPGEDFVEYFLTVQQRGYCVYYASAMAVMLRSQGIEARWVNGFVVPLEPGVTRYEVKGSQAHAWVEANLPGVGWVTFDPTPRADFPLPTRAEALPQRSDDEPSLPDTLTPPAPELDPIDELPAVEGSEPQPTASVAPASGRQSTQLLLGLAGLTLVGGLLASSWRRWEPRGHGRQATITAFLSTSRLLGLFGLARQPAQTSQEYARTVTDQWPELPLRQLADQFDQARYGPADLPAPTGGRIAWQQTTAAVRARYGWRYYLRRLFGRRGRRG